MDEDVLKQLREARKRIYELNGRSKDIQAELKRMKKTKQVDKFAYTEWNRTKGLEMYREIKRNNQERNKIKRIIEYIELHSMETS